MSGERVTRVIDYFARNNIAYEFSAMPASQNGQAYGGYRTNTESLPANNSLAFQELAQNNDRSRAMVQNQMIIARRVPADKVSEITRTISGKPLVLKAMDQASVQERRLVAENSNLVPCRLRPQRPADWRQRRRHKLFWEVRWWPLRSRAMEIWI